jgi:putative transposase
MKWLWRWPCLLQFQACQMLEQRVDLPGMKKIKPAIYHCISRVVDRRFVFGGDEREKFRMFMRMQENFSGCRVLAYCVMSNHFHVLLEVPPMPEGGISDEELLKRLRAIYTEARWRRWRRNWRGAEASGNE